MTADPMQKVLPREDWQWLADQLRAWPEQRVHPQRTMCDGALRSMAADVIEAALALLTREEEVRGECWQSIETAPWDSPFMAGLWVRNNKTGHRWWEAYLVSIDDETGEAQSWPEGEPLPWTLHDFEAWRPLPAPPKDEA